MERLDKFLANAGAGTRSEVKKMIRSGRVCVNGSIVKNGDQKIAPEADDVSLDGISYRQKSHQYFLFHKPSGCITATEDHHDKTVMDYITVSSKKDLFPVGRLDKDTEGLLLITDDGDLAHRLLSPRKHVPKTYFARITGCINPTAIPLFHDGIDIGDDKPTMPACLEILKTDPDLNESEIMLTIHEGRFHQVKRMFHSIGHEVIYLKRISMGSITLDADLPAGSMRPLTETELTELITSIGGKLHES